MAVSALSADDARVDFILVLFSFLYATAVTHVLSTAGEIIIASKRIRLSSFKDPPGHILLVLEATM